MYSVYCSNQKVSLDTIEECNKKTQFKNFLEERFSHPKCKLQPLTSFLIKPVQRICKYPLLLKELMKHVTAGTPDQSKLTQALGKYHILFIVFLFHRIVSSVG